MSEVAEDKTRINSKGYNINFLDSDSSLNKVEEETSIKEKVEKINPIRSFLHSISIG